MKATLELTVAELDCADEARQIENALGRLAGVEEVRTAVSARRAIVSFDPARIEPPAIRDAIRGLGMTVTDTRAPLPARRRPLHDWLGWAFVSVIALIALVGIIGERLGLVETLVDRIPTWLALAAVLAGGYPIFRNVVRALRNRSVTSHALMTLGIVGAIGIGQYAAAAVIVFFMRLADFIEGYATDRSRQAIEELLKLGPQTARVERVDGEVEVAADDVARGDVVLVKPGERIPVDGVVIDGSASVDQAPITGESVPVAKQAGDQVFAATICARGALRVRTDRVGRDTTFGQIVRLVEEAEAAKAPVQRFADRFTAYYIPVVVLVAVATYLASRNATAAVATVLVACSCAIAMATPVTVLAAVGRAARRGIIIKGGRYLEALAKIDTVVMDKTGTLTIGRPDVTDVVALNGHRDRDVLASTAALERRSEHPLAEGIVRAAERAGHSLSAPTNFEAIPGEGVMGDVHGRRVWCGTERLMARAGVEVPSTVRAHIATLADGGKSTVLVAVDGELGGIVALADTLRPEVPGALAALRALGVRRLLLLTGDRTPVARAMAAKLGVEFEAELLPDDKIRVIERLQRQGHVVAMVGDGVNDAPALAQADVGIAMGVAGTDAAIEAAHVALMGDDWRAVPEAIALGRRAFRTIEQNLWFTAAYNVVGMLLAVLGWLPPILAAAAQALPDVAVMLNSSRLLRGRD
ncbi:MAG: cation-translocating P-type ATPase [Candidatus Rokubacteria bacterium]|nr:cation-translocating P-type ATPase [Candidatus Rokubacteria bacterium]